MLRKTLMNGAIAFAVIALAGAVQAQTAPADRPWMNTKLSADERAKLLEQALTDDERYGLLHGTILNVSQDAIARDKPAERGGDKALGAETTSSEPRGQELLYSARISLDRTQLQIEDKQVNLSPGMAVTAEIKTGARRIISYLLSPLARYHHDSLRER